MQVKILLSFLLSALISLVCYSTVLPSLDTLSTFDSDDQKLDYIFKIFNQKVYSDPDAAFELTAIYDSISQKENTEQHVATYKNMMGMAHYVSLEFSPAIDYFLQSAQFFETSNDRGALARVYNNIATCYQNRSDNEKSTEYFEKALTIYEALGDSTWIGSIHSNLSLQHLYDNNLVKSQYHIDKAIPILKSLENKIYLGLALLTRGNLRIEKKEYKAARQDFKQSMDYVSEQVSPLLNAAALTGIGASYNRLGFSEIAISYLNKGLDIANKINHTDQLKETNRELSDAYEKLGDYRKALSRFKLYSSAKDSAFTIEQDGKLADALTKYETEKKEQQIDLLSTQHELAEVRLTNSRRTSIILGIGFLILSGLIFWMYNLQKKIQKTASEKDTLLREIHHRVKNNLQVISALLTLQSVHLKDDQAKEALQEGQDRVESMALIHKDLYQHDNLKGVNTKDYLEQLISNLFDSYKIDEEAVKLETNIEEIWLDVDTMIPMGLMINELICNALKHAFPNGREGTLIVNLKENDNCLHLIIRDNGIGAPNIENLKKDSFGFSLIQSFARKLNADINYEHDNGLGIELTIQDYIKA